MRIETLVNFHIAALKGQEVDAPKDGNGEPTMVDNWTLIFTDRNTQDQIRITFRQDARDEIVRQLTGGVVLAGGDLPRL